MQYRTMPGSDEKLSVLGFGCMRFQTTVGGAMSGLIKKDKALHQLKYAFENGVNYFDTAWPYHMGASETLLGEFIQNEGIRDKVKLATKLPCYSITREQQMEEIFCKQLEKLQTDYIDYYLMHALDGKYWDKMKALGIIDFMNKLRKDGRVKHIGFSFHGPKEDFMRIVDEYDWEFVQVQYNILDVSYQAGIEGIEYAHSKGMGVIVMEPLRGGSLVGKMPKEIAKIYKSAAVKRSFADWALRFIYNHPAVTVVLSGMNKDEHINENIRIASDAVAGAMSDKEIKIIKQVREAYLRLQQVNCTGCAYCMPCPAGINIPAAFKNLNNYHMFSKTGARMEHARYLGTRAAGGKAHWTSSCLDCGKCEERCPQHIEIRNSFKQVQNELEGPVTKAVAALARKLSSKEKERK